MTGSVSKNSNSTASLRAKQTPAEFPKILSNGINKEIYPKKIIKTDKNAKKTLVVYNAKLGWL